MPTPLTEITANAKEDLDPHLADFDAVIVAGDMHGAPIGALIASAVDKPLMIVCAKRHACCVSHIVMIGDITPAMRFLYVDDMFAFGASLRHVFDYITGGKTKRGRIRKNRNKLFDYMHQSAPCAITATYEATTRNYERIKENAPTD